MKKTTPQFEIGDLIYNTRFTEEIYLICNMSLDLEREPEYQTLFDILIICGLSPGQYCKNSTLIPNDLYQKV